MTEEASSLRERLQEEIGPCLASDLQAHIERGAVVVVHDEMDLLDVAVAVAEDDVTSVKEWIESGRMKTPSPTEIAAWKEAPSRPFRSVIVRPYVLVQELST